MGKNVLNMERTIIHRNFGNNAYHSNNRVLHWYLSLLIFLIWMTHALSRQKWCCIFLFNLVKKNTNRKINPSTLVSVKKLDECWERKGETVGTWDTIEASANCFFLLSCVQKYEYNPMPQTAIKIPIIFLSVNGSWSSVYPKPRTRHVFRWPSTWYVTGEVLPITRNVLKFTATAMRHERAMNNCTHVHFEVSHMIFKFADVFEVC